MGFGDFLLDFLWFCEPGCLLLVGLGLSFLFA